MKILIIVGGAFLLLGLTVILIISCLPSPMIAQLIHRIRKRSADVKDPTSESTLRSAAKQEATDVK